MQSCKSGSYLLLTVIAALALISSASIAAAQNNDRPWMNPSLSSEERADLVLKQLTSTKSLGYSSGNGMAHAPQWQTPLSNLTNGGAGYVEGVERLGIPPLVISGGVRTASEGHRRTLQAAGGMDAGRTFAG
jgi:beta-glucosidase